MRRESKALFVLVLVSLITRLVFILIKPPAAVALDMHYWEEVAAAFRSGLNPYAATTRLNWPPLWPLCLWILYHLCDLLQLSLQHGVQALLLISELLLLKVLYGILKKTSSEKAAFNILLFGMALNPICIFLDCQHLNFDVLVALFIALFIKDLLLFLESSRACDWIKACGFLGLGIMSKTVPVVLLPLLALKSSSLRPNQLLKGGAILFLPCAISMLIIYLLAPEDVLRKVVQYRSVGWGFLPLVLSYLRLSIPPRLHTDIFFAALLILISAASALCRKTEKPSKELVIPMALFLMGFVPCFGPGYGNQYIWWIIPLTICNYAIASDTLRKQLSYFYIVALCSYSFDYLFTPEHGFLLSSFKNNGWIEWAFEMRAVVSSGLRLFLFSGYLLLIVSALASFRFLLKLPARV